MVDVTAAAPVEKFMRAAKLAALCLLAAIAVMMMRPDEARADYGVSYADSDGYVPVYSGCWAGSQVGLYNWYFDGYAVYGTITINDCALQAMGAGPNDRARVLAHEQGHAMGLPHSWDPASYMYEYLIITGT
jgi:hypothetical protein